MAVVEIARIQVRRGQENQTGVPQLAGGEFAWATDNENLYIGLRREDGGARDTNIRILTENDFRLMTNFMSATALSADYTWEQPIEGESTDAAGITSLDADELTSVTRTSQDKLDDFVTIADFGVVSSTSTQCHLEIQNAIDHLFLDYDVEDFTTVTSFDPNGTLKYNKKLYFPAGIYRIGETIFIPRNTVIVGEGIDKTIIEVVNSGTSAFQTVDWEGRRSESAETASNLLQGRFEANTSTVVYSITENGQPKNIHIEGMTIKHANSDSLISSQGLISLDCVDNALIRRVKFQGQDTGSVPVANHEYTGIDIRGYPGGDSYLVTENILIDNCQFTGLYYDIKSNYDTNSIVIQNNSFSSSAYGVAFSTTTNALATTGPTYVRMINNKFQDIFNEGIYVGENTISAPTFHVSENNSFVGVGDRGDQGEVGGTSVIKFGTAGNSSVNDYFGREQYHNSKIGTALDSVSTYYPLINGRSTIDLNSVSIATSVANVSTVIMRLPITGNSQYMQIKYTAQNFEVDPPINRFGFLQIYIQSGFDFTNPRQVKLIDEYNTSGSDGGLYWGISSEQDYRFLELVTINPNLTTDVALELQTKLML